jgi:hypothetical protein
MTKAKIGILGSGEVAQALATGFTQLSYEVMVGTRGERKRDAWRKSNPEVQLSDFAGAARFGDLLVLAVKGSAATAVMLPLANVVEGKTIIDTTNPFTDAPPQHGVLNFFTTVDHSLLEHLQETAPRGHFVKAFTA